jgi:hypothetical protein
MILVLILHSGWRGKLGNNASPRIVPQHAVFT